MWGGFEFTAYDPETTTWNDVPGVYVFAGLSDNLLWWVAKYVGQTSSFRERMQGHEKWAEAKLNGATHIHSRVVHDEFQRTAIETALIQAYSPVLNQRDG